MRSPLPLIGLALAACAAPAPVAHPAETQAPVTSAATDGPSRARSLVEAPDRSARDRELDAGRHPLQLLEFLALGPGMKVADLGAGPGYTTELLARAVQPGGTVFMHNEPTWLPFLGEALAERFTHPAMQRGVVRVDRPFEDPLPPAARNLDLVVMNLIYHDIVNTPTDRAKMNANIFAALAPGGAYVVIDASAREGSGISATGSIHRIDRRVVEDEVPRAGFRLAAEGSFLRNPADPRDWDASPTAADKAGRRGASDRFALRFVRPS